MHPSFILQTESKPLDRRSGGPGTWLEHSRASIGHQKFAGETINLLHAASSTARNQLNKITFDLCVIINDANDAY